MNFSYTLMNLNQWELVQRIILSEIYDVKEQAIVVGSCLGARLINWLTDCDLDFHYSGLMMIYKQQLLLHSHLCAEY